MTDDWQILYISDTKTNYRTIWRHWQAQIYEVGSPATRRKTEVIKVGGSTREVLFTKEEILSIFYRADGIDMSYQHEKITWKDHELLLDLVNRLSGLMEKAGKAEN